VFSDVPKWIPTQTTTNIWHLTWNWIDSDEFTYHLYIDSDVDEDLDDDLTDDQDEKAFGDDIVESSISIFLENHPSNYEDYRCL